MNILEKIAEKTKERIGRERQEVPLLEVREEAERVHREGRKSDFAFEQALAADGISFICEVKKASPSKGLIAPEFPYLEIAEAYEAAGAAAVSCLTEPFYFQGSDAYLKEIAETVRIPVLRKDFTVDEYMIYQAKAFGADAVLLICALLDDAQLLAYGQLARELGLSALTEAHTEEEIERALTADTRIIGVNNRDLKTFQVDIKTSARLRPLVPPEILFVSESGIRDGADICTLRQNGTDAVLIGETLMRTKDKKELLARWKKEAEAGTRVENWQGQALLAGKNSR